MRRVIFYLAIQILVGAAPVSFKKIELGPSGEKILVVITVENGTILSEERRPFSEKDKEDPETRNLVESLELKERLPQGQPGQGETGSKKQLIKDRLSEQSEKTKPEEEAAAQPRRDIISNIYERRKEGQGTETPPTLTGLKVRAKCLQEKFGDLDKTEIAAKVKEAFGAKGWREDGIKRLQLQKSPGEFPAEAERLEKLKERLTAILRTESKEQPAPETGTINKRFIIAAELQCSGNVDIKAEGAKNIEAVKEMEKKLQKKEEKNPVRGLPTIEGVAIRDGKPPSSASRTSVFLSMVFASVTLGLLF